jgi:hypothetical protein
MADRNQPPLQSVRAPRRLWGIVILALIILVPSGLGFGNKLEGGFAILPLLVYLAVAAGFICLLTWAIFQGMFKDVERPKYTMLENEERIERGAQSR